MVGFTPSNLGTNYICITTTTTVPTPGDPSVCTQAFYDSGFISTSALPAGRYVWLIRGAQTNPQEWRPLELRLYQTPNLISLMSASVITSYAATTPDDRPASNLVTNLGNRSALKGESPFINAND